MCSSNLEVEKLFIIYVGIEIMTAVVMNVAIFWDIAPCSPYVNRCFGGTYHLRLQDRKSAEQETSVQQVPRLITGYLPGCRHSEYR
jgi:hypothetical protein